MCAGELLGLLMLEQQAHQGAAKSDLVKQAAVQTEAPTLVPLKGTLQMRLATGKQTVSPLLAQTHLLELSATLLCCLSCRLSAVKKAGPTSDCESNYEAVQALQTPDVPPLPSLEDLLTCRGGAKQSACARAPSTSQSALSSTTPLRPLCMELELRQQTLPVATPTTRTGVDLHDTACC